MPKRISRTGWTRAWAKIPGPVLHRTPCCRTDASKGTRLGSAEAERVQARWGRGRWLSVEGGSCDYVALNSYLQFLYQDNSNPRSRGRFKSCPFIQASKPYVQYYNKHSAKCDEPAIISHRWPIQDSKQTIILHIGIIPIPPPPPEPPRDPPRLAAPPAKLLPLLLLLADLLFVTPAEAWPLALLPDIFLFVFHLPRGLPRPLLPPRLFELS